MNKTVKDIRPNIAFAGLTAAGKTTHAKILAEQLGYEYVSATETIMEIIGIKGDPNGIWFSNYETIEKAREGDKIDIELEARMTKLLDSRGGLVLDTWAMAWIYDGSAPLIRIWIESDEESRTRKCFVSQDENKTLNLDGCLDLITKKDSETRDKFQTRLDFDLFNDRQKYDVIINNSLLIPTATDEDSKKGIATLAPVVRDVTEFLLQKNTLADFDAIEQLQKKIETKWDGMITFIDSKGGKIL